MAVVAVPLAATDPGRRPGVTTGRRDDQMRPRRAGVSGLRSVAVAVVSFATPPTTNPGSGGPDGPDRQGRWMGGSRGGGSPYMLRP